MSYHTHYSHVNKQRGVVLFFTLIALLAMSLAAVALIRSVDTSSMIAGNLAFKQSATNAGDAGIEAAVAWLATTDAGTTLPVVSDPTHPFNLTCLEVRPAGTSNPTDPGCANADLTPGYYSNVDPNLSLTNGLVWNDVNSVLVGTDDTGNEIRYVIQRMCRDANTPLNLTQCLYSGASEDKNGQAIPLAQDICQGAGCPKAGQIPQIRITARVQGVKNAVSYIQSFVY